MIVMSDRVLTIEIVFPGIEQPKMAESVKVIAFNLEGEWIAIKQQSELV